MILKKYFYYTIFIANITSCGHNTNVNLGDKYKLINSASYGDLTIVTEQNIVLIDGHILDYAFDSVFIIAAQRPRNSVPECTGTILGMTKSNCDEAFKKSKFCQYWIINKKEKIRCRFDTLTQLAHYSNVCGPYKKEEYIQKREELGVKKELQMKE